ncbi:MAG: redoxin domain-containing protein [Pirellulales bacterium]|nr:redoxin domain-containing protein [Pirellulales bacterium]
MVGFYRSNNCGRFAAIVVCLGLALLLGCTRGERQPKEKEAPEKPEQLTGQEILQRMVAAYRDSASYSDQGKVRLDFVIDGQKEDKVQPFSLTFARPNKLRLQADLATIVCDGENFYAKIEDVPDFAARKPAPKRPTMETLLSDPVLAEAWAGGIGDLLPQVLLLLTDDPLKYLLNGVEEVALLESGEIDGRQCYRLRLSRADGAATFWIDEESFVLRRLVMPTNVFRQELSRYGRVDSVSRVADFIDARLDANIPPQTFEFTSPKGAEHVKYFPPGPIRMLGKKSPKLNFVDLDGKPFTIQTSPGKIFVLDFWATWCKPCYQTLPNFEKLRLKYKDNPKVAFYAVSVDEPNTGNDELMKTFDELKVAAPILRDPEQSAAALKFLGIPTLFVIGPDGVVEYCQQGGSPDGGEGLVKKIDALLAGKSVFRESFREFMESYAGMIEAQLNPEDESSGGRLIEEQKLPEVKIAPKSDPARLKLASLWKSAEVKSPGNVLAVPGNGGPARLMVVEQWKSVAELSADGKLIALHKLELDESEAVGNLRTAVGGDGRRYYVAFLISQQRCHIYDENWKLLAHYPDNALKNPHSGIADAAIGDLDGDGKPNVYVGYFGLAGVQGVSLEGKRLWANRSVSDVICVAIGGPTPKGNRDLFCASNRIVVIDHEGKSNGQIVVPDRSFNWIATADLLGDGRWHWCGLSAATTGENVLVGFTPDGKQLWDYTLPAGVPQKPIEPIVVGRLARDGPERWILPGVDGSVHVISADGAPFDKFNYGAELHGLTAVEINGRPALVVATAEGIEAWEVN